MTTHLPAVCLLLSMAGFAAFAHEARGPLVTECSALASRVPALAAFFRTALGATPLNEHFLPRGVYKISGDVFTPADRTAFELQTKHQKEVAYIEALGPHGGSVAFSEHLVSRSASQVTGSWEQLLNFLAVLQTKFPDRTQQKVAVLSLVHTHPISPFLSNSDLRHMLFVHALIELFGGNEIEIRESIIYRWNGILQKKTIVIPAGSISHSRGDYNIGATLELAMSQFRKMSLSLAKPVYLPQEFINFLNNKSAAE